VFGLEPGAFSQGKLVAALKELGFDLVLDTNTGADITICEEAAELLARLRAKGSQGPSEFGTPGGSLPMFTSCCPGWLAYIEKSAPELSGYISSCKSPHMIYGALIKEYSRDLLGVTPDHVYLTSIMPCVRKRGESDQECFRRSDGVREVDNVVTTKDIGQMFLNKGIDPGNLEPIPFDSPFQLDSGDGSGAGQLFGSTGGVMEAALRSVYELVTGKPLEPLKMDELRGLDGVKEAVVTLDEGEFCENGKPFRIKVAVCNGLGNAKQLIQKMKAGEASYDFVEVMACPGGCIGGGGQPKCADKDVIRKRMQAIYNLDQAQSVRRSHENPNVKAWYTDKYLGSEAGSETSHKLLHVEPVYKKDIEGE
jgi:iron-only hydrogenase group A